MDITLKYVSVIDEKKKVKFVALFMLVSLALICLGVGLFGVA